MYLASDSKQGRSAFAKKSTSPKYDEDVRNVIISLLTECPVPRDAMPYTEHFEKAKRAFIDKTGLDWSESKFWIALSDIGKKGGFGKGTRKRGAPSPRLTEEEQLEIIRLFPEGIGRRDRLPYTPQFEVLYSTFQERTGRELSRYEFWRAVSRVAKRSRKPKPIFEVFPLGGLQPELVQAIERMNPWWKGEPGIPVAKYRRHAFTQARKRLEEGFAKCVVIRGPRQVGKTTIQHQLIEDLLLLRNENPVHILRVQFDEIPLGLGTLKNPIESLVRWYEDSVLGESINALAKRGEKVHLFFDEVQNLPRWSEQIKFLVDHTNLSLLVTGSSAMRIAAGRDSLAGRISEITLGPLRLYEVAGLRGIEGVSPYCLGGDAGEWAEPEFWTGLLSHYQSQKANILRAYRHYSRFGGYPVCSKPEVKSSDEVELAKAINEAVVKRMVSHDPQRVDPLLLNEVFLRVCRYAGESTHAKTIAEEVGQVLGSPVSKGETDKAIQHLVDSLLVHSVPPMELRKKKQKSGGKLCICDHFVRRACLQEVVPLHPLDLKNSSQSVRGLAGALVESVLGYYLAGLQDVEVSWFPERGDEPEVDFVVSIGITKIPIEVKYRQGKLDRSWLKGLIPFCSREHYNAPFGILMTQEHAGWLDADVPVIAVPAPAFLLVQ